MRSQGTARRSPLRRLVAITAAATVLPGVLAGTTPAQATPPSFTRIEGTAGGAAGLAPTVDAFRTLLGGPNNVNAPGSQPGGRREISWDGLSDALAAPHDMPRDLFNTTHPRGVVFASSTNRFQASADSANPTGTLARFGDIRWSNVNSFATSSPERLFSPRGTTLTTVRFYEPGTGDRATVKGFGAVFTDVDRGDSTKIELYDRWGQRLWNRNVPRGANANGSLSFLGVKTSARIYEVKITSGNSPLSANASDGGATDLVVLDDLIYGEPRPLP
ncbi:hypothetical protein GTQ99_05750 [Kineococcus sp. T13]|uniref:hypothetical protein n=1 Tax=Kineococcus vitellinus TaxID=2696565 RepID=UPI001411D943|nr:hypothetical protein [Kineococcus vitellinus]NAZ74928.1 hypothetical protein [Kineococcus vitellinus]